MKRLVAYGCPACGEHNSRPAGWVYRGIVTVECGACGFVERFERGYLADEVEAQAPRP